MTLSTALELFSTLTLIFGVGFGLLQMPLYQAQRKRATGVGATAHSCARHAQALAAPQVSLPGSHA